MAIREGRWDCPQCGARGNRGAELKCGGCGRVRGEEVAFYLADEAPEVSDEAALARAQAGADWICEFCSATTPADQPRCRSCGAERTEKRREVREHRDAPEPVPPVARPKKKRRRLAWVAGALAVLGLFLVCRSTEKPMELVGVGWERTIEVERFATVQKEGWADDLPAGARVHATERRFSHNRQVQIGTRPVTRTVSEEVQTGTRREKVGTRDMGNGYFEDVYENRPVYETRHRTVHEDEPVFRDEPVYRNWARYEIDTWIPDHVERAAGTDKSPRWPEPTLAGARLREGKRVEAYRASFRDARGEQLDWTPALGEWQGLEPGRTYKLKLRFGKIEGLAR